jgi:glycosyltransferase involved in cell wall biosynthesis
MQKNMDITVCLCTYNRADMLRLALESLGAQETEDRFSYEILVVDDGCTDNTPELVREMAENLPVPVRYLQALGKGIAHARTRGVEASSGQWIAFFDDDQEADPSWLKELMQLASEKQALCVGGRNWLRFYQQAPAQLSPITRAVLGEVDYGGQPLKCNRKSYPGCGNALVHKKVFELVGSFDENLIWAGEDLDFFRRVRMRGIEAWYAPNAVIYHLTPPYRLTGEYLFRTSLRSGENFAYRDFQEWGLAKTLLASIIRCGQALFITIPRLVKAYLVLDKAEILGRKCLLHRARGYGRGSLNLLAPNLFQKENFLAKIEFRKERHNFERST